MKLSLSGNFRNRHAAGKALPATDALSLQTHVTGA
jgi:hypothetical protein